MIIGFDAKRAFLNSSGLGNYSRDVIRSLVDNLPNNDYVLFTPQMETCMLESRYCGNVVIPRATTALARSLWRRYGMRRDIVKNHIDVYHGLSNELPSGIATCGCGKVVTIHDLIFKQLPQLYHAIDRRLYDYKSRHACNVADVIVATSQQTKADIMRYYHVPDDRICVVYQSCNRIFADVQTEATKEAVRARYGLPQRYLLTVGTIERRKNALNVVKALAQLHSDIDYVLVGRHTSYADELKKYATEKGLSQRLFFVHNAATSDLPAIYQAATLFVYPSLYEGFGIPIVEALYSRVPIITGLNGCTAEIAGNAATNVNVNSPNDIAYAINNLWHDNNLRNKLILKGLQRAKIFTQKNQTDKLYSIYKSLI